VKWHSGIRRPEDMPTIDQAVVAAEQLQMRRNEETLLHALGSALLPMLTSGGVARPQLDRLREALDRVSRQ
jgi:hypothetical protein